MPNADSLQLMAKRLAAGERNPGHLDALFLELRARHFGNKAVADVGNFAAHSVERDEGSAWKGVKATTAILDYQSPRMRAKTSGLPPPSDKQVLIAAALAALSLDPPATVKKETRVGKDRATAALKRALSKVDLREGQVICPTNHLTALEERVMWRYSSLLTNHAAFTDAQLTAQLADVLLQNGLITKGDEVAILSQREFIGVYALVKMHLCRLILDDGRIGHLFASVGPEATLYVTSLVEVHMGDGPIFFGLPIYNTSCVAADWCTPEALAARNGDEPWLVPLELTQTGKLQVL